MKTEEIPFPRTAGIWGQFLNSDGEVNEEIKCSFLYKVDNANSTEELLECFEFKILFAKTAIENFYSHLALI